MLPRFYTNIFEPPPTPVPSNHTQKSKIRIPSVYWLPYFIFKYLKKVLADYSAEIIPYLIVYFIKRFIL